MVLKNIMQFSYFMKGDLKHLFKRLSQISFPLTTETQENKHLAIHFV
jgi:hypothetical protein